MRQIAAKAIILSLAIIIATILIAPQVDLDPVAPRLEWAAYLIIVFLTWLAMLGNFCLLPPAAQQSSSQRAALPARILSSVPCPGDVQLRC